LGQTKILHKFRTAKYSTITLFCTKIDMSYLNAIWWRNSVVSRMTAYADYFVRTLVGGWRTTSL